VHGRRAAVACADHDGGQLPGGGAAGPGVDRGRDRAGAADRVDRDHQRVQASDQGLAGALFTTSQQTGAAVGLAILATAAAAATAAYGGSLVDGYRLSFAVATGLAVLAAVIVALQLRSQPSRAEPAREQPTSGGSPPGHARRVEAPRMLSGRPTRAPAEAWRVPKPRGVRTPADAGAVSRLMRNGR
jgi:hypothetical protein